MLGSIGLDAYTISDAHVANVFFDHFCRFSVSAVGEEVHGPIKM